MNKLFVFLLAAGAFLVLLIVGRYWNLRPDTAEKHIVHKGEMAVLTRSEGEQVWLATNKRHCYSLQVAMTSKDTVGLKNYETREEAFPVPLGTPVKVVDESISTRQVVINEGPLAGKQGWVEFEYLRPRKSGEFN